MLQNYTTAEYMYQLTHFVAFCHTCGADAAIFELPPSPRTPVVKEIVAHLTPRPHRCSGILPGVCSEPTNGSERPRRHLLRPAARVRQGATSRGAGATRGPAVGPSPPQKQQGASGSSHSAYRQLRTPAEARGATGRSGATRCDIWWFWARSWSSAKTSS